jgi:anti-sigma factor RsiW
MTPDRDCDQLDAYLLGDLPKAEATCFESHLEVCSNCLEAVEEQRWIDGLLQSSVRAQLEPTPTTLVDSVRTVAVRHDRRKTVLTYVLTMAATLLIAVAWLAFRRPATQPMQSATQEIAIEDAPRAPKTKSDGTFVSTSDAIVVPVNSPSDDVTIVQIYQTTESERRWRLDRTLSNISTKPNGG